MNETSICNKCINRIVYIPNKVRLFLCGNFERCCLNIPLEDYDYIKKCTHFKRK